MAASKIKGINIKIGADPTGLNTALDGIEKAGKEAKTELREVERALKSAPESAELWRQKQELLTKAVEESRKKVEFLEEAQKQVQEQFEKKEIDDGAYRAFQRELEKARAESDKLGEQLEATAEKISGAGKKSEDAFERTKNELQEVEKALKDAPKSAELWRQKQELLTKAIEESKNKVKLLEDAQEHIAQQLKDGQISSEQYREFQRELEKARSESQRLEDQLGNTSKKIYDLENGTENGIKSTRELGDSMEDTGKKADNMGDEIEDAGKQAENSSDGFTVMKGALADLAAEGVKKAVDGLKEMTQLAMDFDDAMAKVNTIADGSVPIEKLEEDIKNLSDETGIEAKQIAENVYNAISAGQKTGDAVNFVGKATELSRAGFADSANALDILTTVMNAYGMEAAEVSRVSDVLIQTQNLGKTTVAELSSSMGKIIPTANAQKVSLEQLAAGYAIMTANGIATAETTTYMNSMLNELGKGSTNVSKLLKEETGKSFSELSEEGWSLSEVLALISEKAAANGQSFSDIWSSSESGKAALVLLGDGAETFNTALSQMEASAGSTETALEKLNTESYKLEKAQNKLKNAGIEAGKKVMEVITPLIDKAIPKLNNAVDWAVENLPKIKDKIREYKPLILGIGAAVGTLKIADKIEKARGALEKFNVTMLKNPYAAVAAGVIGITTAVGKWISQNNDVIIVTDEMCEKLREEYKAIDDTKKKIDDLNDSFNKNAGEVDAEFDRIQSLKDELDKLADASGNVRDKDKARVEYILGELSEALGEEYRLTGNQIENYSHLSDEIDKVIAKKRAEAMLTAYNAQAAEMAQAKSDARNQLATAETNYQTAQSLEYAAQSRFDRLNTKGYSVEQVLDEKIDGDSELFEAAKELRAATNRTAEAETNVNTAYSSYEATVDYEQRSRDAMQMFNEGRYTEMEDLIYAVKDANEQILKDEKRSNYERAEAYKESLKLRTNELKAAIDVGSQYEIDAAFRAIKATVESGQQAGNEIVLTSQLISAEMRGQIQRAMNEGYDLNGLADWMSEAGLTLADVFGENYTDVIQNQLDKGYDISGLAKWAQKSDIKMTDIFGEKYTKVIQSQLDKGYDTTALLAWATDTSGKLLGKVDMEFLWKVQNRLNAGFSNDGLISWADSASQDMGDIMVGNISGKLSNVAQKLFAPLKYTGIGNLPHFATGGYIPAGSSGIVAEAGPELLQVMNGGIKVTPLTEKARNTETSSVGGSQKIFYNTYNINNPKITNGMDVRRLAESLASEQRRIETGRGE